MIEQIYLLIVTLFLAGKDATSFRLFGASLGIPLKYKRIRRWHRDGVALNVLSVLPLIYYTGNLWLVLYALLIRLSVFDLGFNKWAGLPITHLGSTATVDKIFSKIFGEEGAVKKSIFFFILLILLNILM